MASRPLLRSYSAIGRVVSTPALQSGWNLTSRSSNRSTAPTAKLFCYQLAITRWSTQVAPSTTPERRNFR